MRKITLTLIAMLSFFGVFAQIGSTCTTPYLINSLPFNVDGNTDSTGNNYSINASAYSDGNDFVFEYTPIANEYVNITVTNTSILCGLFVTEGCPDVGTFITSNEAVVGNPLLTNVYLTSGVTYFITISSNSLSGFGTETTAFNLDIIKIAAKDLTIIALAGLQSGCSLTTDTLFVTVENLGAEDVSGYDISYTVNGGGTVTETISNALLSGETRTDTLTSTIDLSTQGLYIVDVTVELLGDENLLNDNASTNAVNTPEITTYPYSENFDNLTNMWWFAEGTNSTWAIGTPVATLINAANSAPNSWVTNLTGNADRNENSNLVSPCFNFSGLNFPKITFDYWMEAASSIAIVNFEYSTDNGLTWIALSAGSVSTNFNFPLLGTSTAGWVSVSTVNEDLAGYSNIKFRFNYSGALISDVEGFAIDNFGIEECTGTTPTAGFTYVANGEHVEFTNTSTGATSYSWDFGDLQSSTDENPVHDYFAFDNAYLVTLTVFGDCSSITFTDSVAIIITNIENISLSNINVYPNPANEILNINTNYVIDNVVITDITGKIIENISLNTQQNSINISDLENGIYFVKITSNNNVFVKQFVKN